MYESELDMQNKLEEWPTPSGSIFRFDMERPWLMYLFAVRLFLVWPLISFTLILVTTKSASCDGRGLLHKHSTGSH
ncbi:hypothetical protein LX32DRAFT_460581 [Colletotrichum zoysiae]|uniref:Uncharacterized protein n=1 Tax=Colletotrichum zoysiae TaxID=1216348 RepID=A0AAD9LYA7_9PEZI|nr:hypothetical protein LX32DRAFT_460581 [Colletotrichum zoysiae]